MGGLQPRVRAAVIVIALLLVLIPAGVFAWQWRAMPHLGVWHDDAVYWVSAKSLADGGGYRILNLAGAPAQTKYPPLYPLLLSLVWRIAPAFPGNAPLLMLVQWSMLPLLVVLLWLWFRQIGFADSIAAGLTAVVGLCPMTTMFATTCLSEIPFVSAVLATLLVLGSSSRLTAKRAMLAGICAAAAVLMRTNGIVLAAAVPIAMLLPWRRSRFRAALAFLAPVLVAFAGWQLWCDAHRIASTSDIVAYYTDYTGFYRHSFSLADFPHRVWVNVDGLLTSVGRLILWSTSDASAYRQLCWALAIFAFIGWRDLFRRGERASVLFATASSVLLLVWEFPPDQRFTYPLLPFAVAGLATSIGRLVARIGLEWNTSRAAAVAMSCVVLTLPASILLLDKAAYRETLPQWGASQARHAAAMRGAYAWITQNTPRGAVIAAYDDPVLWLYTARRSTSVAVLPSLVYDSNNRTLTHYVAATVRDWDHSGVEYALTTPRDFSREFQETARNAQNAELAKSWRPLVQTADFTIWARPQPLHFAASRQD